MLGGQQEAKPSKVVLFKRRFVDPPLDGVGSRGIGKGARGGLCFLPHHSHHLNQSSFHLLFALLIRPLGRFHLKVPNTPEGKNVKTFPRSEKTSLPLPSSKERSLLEKRTVSASNFRAVGFSVLRLTLDPRKDLDFPGFSLAIHIESASLSGAASLRRPTHPH